MRKEVKKYQIFVHLKYNVNLYDVDMQSLVLLTFNMEGSLRVV